MHMLTSPIAIRLRSFARQLGLNRLISGFIGGGRYENRFGPAFCAEMRKGDTVWDVGANVGLYTSLFVEAVGQHGKVVAFEPTTACFSSLKGRFAGAPTVELRNFALGDADGTIAMSVEENPLGANHKVVIGSGTERVSIVEVRTGASLVELEPELFPNVIKIDVEGHEGAVLNGLSALLCDRRLHCIGIEVHFRLLDERGERELPMIMEKALVNKGFCVRWTDPSHMLATR